MHFDATGQAPGCDLLHQGVEPILADVLRGKSVLVCCNTVQRAQEMRAIFCVSLILDNRIAPQSLYHERSMDPRTGSPSTMRQRGQLWRDGSGRYPGG